MESFIRKIAIRHDSIADHEKLSGKPFHEIVANTVCTMLREMCESDSIEIEALKQLCGQNDGIVLKIEFKGWDMLSQKEIEIKEKADAEWRRRNSGKKITEDETIHGA